MDVIEFTNNLKILNPFISHSTIDKPYILPILNFLCLCGIKPWIDTFENQGSIGINLRKAIHNIIHSNQSLCVVVFLSKNSIHSEWVIDEILWCSETLNKGSRIIPIFLEKTIIPKDNPLYPIFYPKDRNDILFLEASDPDFKIKLVKSIYNHYRLDQAENVIFHAGHRLPWNRYDIPDIWQQFHILDFRTEIGDGDKYFNPTKLNWIEIINGLQIVKNALPAAKNIFLCGNTSNCFGAALAIPWGNGSNINLTCWDSSFSQIWSMKYEYLEWKYIAHLLFEIESKNEVDHSEYGTIYISDPNQVYIFNDIKDFIGELTPIYWIKVSNQTIIDNIQVLLNQLLAFLYNILQKVDKIKLFITLALGLVALLSWNMGSIPVNIYDFNTTTLTKYINFLSINYYF